MELPNLTTRDETLIRKIKARTSLLNKNNITRTKAYLDFYLQHPEIHWAFLGHMVSRNGGWNMTDLKGSFLSRLLSTKESTSFFMFLERGNWLIFQDVYPQFLLYEESKMTGNNLFYLFPHFHVSIFMKVIWDYFLHEKDYKILTHALIINEQSYLESRLLQNPTFKKEVLTTVEFKIQDFLSMNHILFPCVEEGKLKLVGETLHHFTSLHERILLGKRLYNILFHHKNRLDMMEKWAKENPHTGSRKDYWPHFFHDLEEGLPGWILKPRIKSCKLIPGASRIFSPKLMWSWKNINHENPEITDWYKDWRVINYLSEWNVQLDGEIENDYCKTLERLELASITKKAISILA